MKNSFFFLLIFSLLSFYVFPGNRVTTFSPESARFGFFNYESLPVDTLSLLSDSVDKFGSLYNPIIPGCYPDPCICRKGDDYYIVNSSFSYFPGVPIWHSSDLIHWERLGFVLDRPSQLYVKKGLPIKAGIYASDISYNPENGLFYMITTGIGCGGTFYVTTDDPRKGKWSDPVFLHGVGGIDPSILFDNDGKAYIVNNNAPPGGAEYSGHCAIWLHDFDWKNNCLSGDRKLLVNKGTNLTEKPIWIEGPHLYHIGNKYFLMAAEGGTGSNHSEVIFESQSPYGPFVQCKINPVLTQRGLPSDRISPVTAAGHADLIQAKSGEWYAVFLAVRPYREDYDLMGRETFLMPVKWKGGQPVICDSGNILKYNRNRSVPAISLWTDKGLANDAFFIRTPKKPFYSVDNKGNLVLYAKPIRLNDCGQPSAIGRWIDSYHFNAETSLEFNPLSSMDFAGIICFQDDSSYVCFGKTLDKTGRRVLLMQACSRGETIMEESVFIPDDAGKIYLRISGSGKVYFNFYYSFDNIKWNKLNSKVSADCVSTKNAGNFTGCMIGVYATSKSKL